MLMSFPESSKPREYHFIGKYNRVFYSFWTLDWWYLECFDVDAESLWNGWELGVGGGAWILQLPAPGSWAASALAVEDIVSFAENQCCAASSSSTSLPILSANLLLIRYFAQTENSQVCLWKALQGESSQGSFNMIAPIRQVKSYLDKVAKMRHLGTMIVPSFLWSQQV